MGDLTAKGALVIASVKAKEGLGRVGERTTPRCGPLSPHRTGRADFPHPALRKALHRRRIQAVAQGSLQNSQPRFVEVLIAAAPFRRSEGPLAASPQMLRETIANVPVDLPEGHPRVPEAEVVRPAVQLPVQTLNQFRNRLEALVWPSHLFQLLPLLLQSLCRRRHVQIAPSASLQIVVTAEREARKVRTRSLCSDETLCRTSAGTGLTAAERSLPPAASPFSARLHFSGSPLLSPPSTTGLSSHIRMGCSTLRSVIRISQTSHRLVVRDSKGETC